MYRYIPTQVLQVNIFTIVGTKKGGWGGQNYNECISINKKEHQIINFK